MMNEDQQSITFIANTIADQRQDDHDEFKFSWLLELHRSCKTFLKDESDLLLKKKIVDDYNDLFPSLYFMRDIAPDDVTVGNYHDKQKELADRKKSSTALIVAEGSDGQTKLVMQRGGRRKGAGRKKSDKEIRTVKIALDESTWIAIEAIKDIEDYKSMTQLLSILIERGLDNEIES